MKELYPEIEELGNLANVLRKFLHEDGFQIRGYDEIMNGSRHWVSVKNESRGSDVCTALDLRMFIAPLWHLGVELASIDTPRVEMLIAVLDAWFVRRVPATELTALSPQVKVSELAADYEAGPGVYVEAVWQRYLATTESELSEVIHAASALPNLRALLPFTSLSTLCFSRTTGYPFTKDAPSIESSTNMFVVVAPSGERTLANTAAEAAAVAARLLPQGLVAVHGRDA